jgi:hypothetical protein
MLALAQKRSIVGKVQARSSRAQQRGEGRVEAMRMLALHIEEVLKEKLQVRSSYELNRA